MKLAQLLLLLPLLFACSTPKPESGVLHHKRVLILGNSITQNGAYVDYLEYYLRTNYPNQQLDIISIGLSSETVNGASELGHTFPRPCIHSRLDSALFYIKPALVIACYGMNDGIFSNPDKGRFEDYKKGILQLHSKIRASGAQLILLTPTLFDPDPVRERVSRDGEAHSYRSPYYKYNEVLESYSTWLYSLREDGMQVIDLHNFLRPILAAAKELKPDSTFIPDGVHPNKAGHFLMAKKVLLDLYPGITMGDPYPTINELASDTLFRLIAQRRKQRSESWLKYIGYVRGEVVKTDEISTTMERIEELDKEIGILLR